MKILVEICSIFSGPIQDEECEKLAKKLCRMENELGECTTKLKGTYCIYMYVSLHFFFQVATTSKWHQLGRTTAHKYYVKLLELLILDSKCSATYFEVLKVTEPLPVKERVIAPVLL